MCKTDKGLLLACLVLFGAFVALVVLVFNGSGARVSSDDEGTVPMIKTSPGGEAWWKTALIYQIYPRSFKDSNGDGTGDIKGIISKVPYLRDLGIDAVWLSPIFDSPMADFGYDVRDYKAIWSRFGTLVDFEALLTALHENGIRLFLDLVPNHTSDENPWFVESRSSLENPKRAWYIWRPPASDGGPPNNWLSFFGGSAWQYDGQTDQYYLHQFLREQPDLNYHNEQVRKAMLDVISFWLGKGVDGFRVDALHTVFESANLDDEPPRSLFNASTDNPFDSLLHIYTQNFPPLHDLVKSFRRLADSFTPERALICEVYAVLPQLLRYYGDNLDECQLPFNFKLLESTMGPELSVAAIKGSISQYLASLPSGGAPNWVLGNHDNHRVGSRIGPEYIRLMNMLLLSLPGSATTYYGEEIGMMDVEIPYNETKDPFARNMKPEIAAKVGRDPERTPMLWTDGPYAGFKEDNGIDPWLPVGTNYSTANVNAQEDSPTSVLSAYKAMSFLRRSECFRKGHFTWFDEHTAGDKVIAFSRWRDEKTSSCLVFLNFGEGEVIADYSSVSPFPGRVLATTRGQSEPQDLSSLRLTLAPFEGVVVQIRGLHVDL